MISSLGIAEAIQVTYNTGRNTLWTEESCDRFFAPHLLEDSRFVFGDGMYPNMNTKILGDFLIGQ